MAKTIKEQLGEKVPDSLQTAQFNLMLNLVKENDLETLEDLKTFVNTKIGTLDLELREKRTSTTMTSEMRGIAKELDMLKDIKEHFFKFF